MSARRAKLSVESEHLGDQDFLHSSAFSFKQRDLDALKVRFQTVSESNVIPAVEGTRISCRHFH